jgi:hypothetical protein
VAEASLARLHPAAASRLPRQQPQQLWPRHRRSHRHRRRQWRNRPPAEQRSQRGLPSCLPAPRPRRHPRGQGPGLGTPAQGRRGHRRQASRVQRPPQRRTRLRGRLPWQRRQQRDPQPSRSERRLQLRGMATPRLYPPWRQPLQRRQRRASSGRQRQQQRLLPLQPRPRLQLPSLRRSAQATGRLQLRSLRRSHRRRSSRRPLAAPRPGAVRGTPCSSSLQLHSLHRPQNLSPGQVPLQRHLSCYRRRPRRGPPPASQRLARRLPQPGRGPQIDGQQRRHQRRRQWRPLLLLVRRPPPRPPPHPTPLRRRRG